MKLAYDQSALGFMLNYPFKVGEDCFYASIKIEERIRAEFIHIRLKTEKTQG